MVNDRKSGSNRLLRWVAAAGLIVLGLLAFTFVYDYFRARELVFENPDSIASDAGLVVFANGIGKAAFEDNCATCHGTDLKGSTARGVPDLTDADWLFDFGRVSDIERTILYGIRSGNGKARNITDMPAVGRMRVLGPEQVNDVVNYVLSLSGRETDQASAEHGAEIFQDQGVCYDCHGRDGAGVPDYGAPNLTDAIWTYGGDAAAIATSVYDGRHGLCPAWIGKLSFPAIRAIAVYVHSMSQESPFSPTNTGQAAALPGRAGTG